MQRFMVASYFICFIPFKRGEDGCGSDEPKGLCQCVLFNGAYIVFTCHFTPCVFPTLASLTKPGTEQLEHLLSLRVMGV